MPTNVKAINKNSQKNKINLYKNKISTLHTTSEPQIQKEKENKNEEQINSVEHIQSENNEEMYENGNDIK